MCGERGRKLRSWGEWVPVSLRPWFPNPSISGQLTTGHLPMSWKFQPACVYYYSIIIIELSPLWLNFPVSSDNKESVCQCRRCWFDPWVRNIQEKWIATHSSILAWIIPWTEDPGGLQSMGSQRVGHDWVTNNFNSTISLPGTERESPLQMEVSFVNTNSPYKR